MESEIVRHLQPEFAPVAVVWSDSIPDDALQFKKGRFGCVLYLFAEASRRRRVAGGNRESITCNGGCAALGLGVDFDASAEQLDRYAAVFSKGLRSASDQGAYRTEMEAVPWAVLGMTDVDGRKAMRKRFRQDILTLTLPPSLFTQMEEEANDCVFQLPSWRALVGRRSDDSESC